MVGIGFFRTLEHYEEVTDDSAQIRKCKQDGSDENGSIREILSQASLRLQGQFGGCFIRRTADSKDNNGNSLLTLPPCSVVDIILKLTERELEFVEDGIPDEALDRYVCHSRWYRFVSDVSSSLSHATASGSVTQSFYCTERMTVTFPREDTNAPIPKFKSKEEWKASRSTKLDAVARLARYLLSSDNTLPPYVDDGKLKFPKLPALANGDTHPQTRKILIYQEYSFFAPLLVNVSPH